MGIDNPVHLIFIAAVALIVLGPKRLPDLARSLGHGMREFRESMSEAAKDEDPGTTGSLVTEQAQLVAAPEPVIRPLSTLSSSIRRRLSIRLSSYRQAMRLIVARCEVAYIGPSDNLSARGGAAADDQVRRLGHGAGPTAVGYKPQNWMTPPTVIEEQDRLDRRAQACGAQAAPGGSRSRSRIAEVLSDVTHDMGEAGVAREGGRGGGRCRSCSRTRHSGAARAFGWCGASGRPTSARST